MPLGEASLAMPPEIVPPGNVRRARQTSYSPDVAQPGPDEVTERLAVVGEIAAEVAHELRNVLQVISAAAYVVRHEVDKTGLSGAALHVAKIERHTRLAHGIVD